MKGGQFRKLEEAWDTMYREGGNALTPQNKFQHSKIQQTQMEGQKIQYFDKKQQK